jgi:hypothetical protein
MPRLARLVVPGLPHHVTQRGNRRQQTFFCEDAYAAYVELNPVRTELVADARDWPWSSARAHLSGRDDGLVRVGPMLAMVADWQRLLDSAIGEGAVRLVKKSCGIFENTFAPAVHWEMPFSWMSWNARQVVSCVHRKEVGR